MSSLSLSLIIAAVAAGAVPAVAVGAVIAVLLEIVRDGMFFSHVRLLIMQRSFLALFR